VPSSPTHAAGPIPAAASAADLATCGTCAWDDPVSHTFSVAVDVAGAAGEGADTITAGPLVLSVSGSSTVKRFLFRVRH
jgi:hypothetical protein